MKLLTRSKLIVDIIFIGHHFETEDSIRFEKCSFVLSNIDKILSPIARFITFNKRAQILEISIENVCLIRFFAKTTVVKRVPGPGTDLKVDSDIEIISNAQNTFEKYRELYNLVLDFFNFFTINDVDFISIRGVYMEHKGLQRYCL